MRQLAEKNSRDSSSMRILTIITMIYLPCTIVSVGSHTLSILPINMADVDQNFYSTQFVDQKETISGGTKLEYAQNAWIFFAISVPLTLFTILVWWLWVNSEKVVRLVRHRESKQEIGPARNTRVLAFRKQFVELPR